MAPQTNFSTVTQTTYSPEQRRGFPGLISHMTPSDVQTWINGSGASVPFGVACSAIPGSPKQARMGGSNFEGISVVDVTQNGVPLNPINGVEVGADVYPASFNMAIIRRGRIWVVAQADVSSEDAVYYETTGGTLSNSASGTAAAGGVTYTEQPAAGDTITLNGTAITWEASGATGSQVNIGETLGQSLMNLAAFINANVAADAQVAKFEADAYPTSPGGAGEGSGANQLLLGARTVGTAGNALTVTTTTAGATVTAMNGGTAAATLIPGARWLDTAVGGEIARIDLTGQR